MGRLFSDMTLEEERAFIEVRRSEQFLAACRRPGIWLWRAGRHKHAADILYEIVYAADRRELDRILAGKHSSGQLVGEELADFQLSALLSEYFLLAGYALECVLKGYLLALLPELVTEEKRLDRVLATHDLCQLCRDCAISLSRDERELLALITRHIVWGKYAAPLRVEDMPSWIADGDQQNKSLAVANPHHDRRVQKLVDRVFTDAEALLAAQRSSGSSRTSGLDS